MAKKEKKYQLFSVRLQLRSVEKWETESDARYALLKLLWGLDEVIHQPETAKKVLDLFEVREGGKPV